MFSKKTLQITVALVLLIGLAAIGLVYGQWTQKLDVNGTASTGTFDVTIGLGYYDFQVDQCEATVSSDGHTLTVKIGNAYPGFTCAGGTSITNLSSIPAKINGLKMVTNDVPADFTFTPPGLVYMNDAKGNSVLPGGSYKLAAGATGGGIMWSFHIPAEETGHEGESYSFSYTFEAEQTTLP